MNNSCTNCQPSVTGGNYQNNNYKTMTKKDIIKQELQGFIPVKGQVLATAPEGFQTTIEGNVKVAVVDLDKLAEFLAKHLKIKSEDLVN